MSEPSPRIACGGHRAARLPKYVNVSCRWYTRRGPCERRVNWEVWLGGDLLDKIMFEHDPTFIDGRILVCGTHCRQLDESVRKLRGECTVHRKREPAVPKNLEVIAHEIAALGNRLQRLGSKSKHGSGPFFAPKEKAERVERDGGV